jgi:hypothetical protein
MAPVQMALIHYLFVIRNKSKTVPFKLKAQA